METQKIKRQEFTTLQELISSMPEGARSAFRLEVNGDNLFIRGPEAGKFFISFPVKKVKYYEHDEIFKIHADSCSIGLYPDGYFHLTIF